MSTTAKRISNSLSSMFGSSPYPTLVSQVQSTIEQANDDLKTKEARIRVLLWQNYPYSRTAAINAAAVALAALLFSTHN